MPIFQSPPFIIVDDNIFQFRTSPLPWMFPPLDAKVLPESLFAIGLNRILGGCGLLNLSHGWCLSTAKVLLQVLKHPWSVVLSRFWGKIFQRETWNLCKDVYTFSTLILDCS